MIVKGRIYGSSYSGCDGWSSWAIRDIRFRCKPERVASAKERAENRVAATSGTYTRRGIEWTTKTPNVELTGAEPVGEASGSAQG